MRKLLITAAVIAVLVGLLAAPALAGEGPERYQSETRTYQIAVLNTYIHNYTVTLNPCDGTIVIDGSTPVDSGYYTEETVTGVLLNGVISFHSEYDGPHDPTYSWNGSFPIAGGALSGDYLGTVTLTGTSETEYKNHGQFVREMGGGADAAHSCIGMPVQAHS